MKNTSGRDQPATASAQSKERAKNIPEHEAKSKLSSKKHSIIAGKYNFVIPNHINVITSSGSEKEGFSQQQPTKKINGTDAPEGGAEMHVVIANVKQLSFEEKLESVQTKAVALSVIDQKTLVFYNQNEDPRKKKIVQKEKNYEFDYVQDEQANNQMLYKQSISPAVQRFVAGVNQSLLVLGGENSGKNHTIVGNMRDPGMFVLAIKEIFDTLYQARDRDKCQMKMSMFGHKGSSFTDLLVDHGYSLKSLQHIESTQETQPFGVSSVIVNNLRTALKILKIGMERMGNDNSSKNIVLSFSCYRGLSTQQINAQVSYATFKIIKLSDDAYQEMASAREESVMVNLTNCLRMLSKQGFGKKGPIVPFSKNVFTQYLKQSICGNSQTIIICCLNNTTAKSNETATTLRLGNLCKRVSTQPAKVKMSPASIAKAYTDTIENLQNTVSTWVKEFWGDLDKPKLKRVRVVFHILRYLERYFQGLLDTFEQQIQIELVRNALAGKVLDAHCKEYSGSITSEDIKEYFIAKIQQHSLKKLAEQNAALSPTFHFVLKYAEDNRERMQANRRHFLKLLNQFLEARKISITQASSVKEVALPEATKITPEFIANSACLTNLDVEKIGFVLKLFPRFQDSCQTLIDHNLYIPQDIRKDFATCMKDFRFLEKTLRDEGIALGDQSVSTSLMSMRWAPHPLKSSGGSRSSVFKSLQPVSQLMRMRSGSRVSEQSLEKTLEQIQNSRSANELREEQGADNNNCSNLSNKSGCQLGNKPEREKADSISIHHIEEHMEHQEDDEEDNRRQEDDENDEDNQGEVEENENEEQGSDDFDSGDEDSANKLSEINRSRHQADVVNSAKIKQLQMLLKITPTPRKIFVNNTKLSFTHGDSFMPSNTLKTARFTERSQITNKEHLSLHNPQPSNIENYAAYFSGSATDRNDVQQGYLPQQQQQTQVQQQQFILEQQRLGLLPETTNPKTEYYDDKDLEAQEENELVKRIFTHSTRYGTNLNGKSKRNIFITQAGKEQRSFRKTDNKDYTSTSLSGMSMTSLNFKRNSNIPSFRKYPSMINTFGSFKLPKLSDTITKEAFTKFFNPVQ